MKTTALKGARREACSRLGFAGGSPQGFSVADLSRASGDRGALPSAQQAIHWQRARLSLGTKYRTPVRLNWIAKDDLARKLGDPTWVLWQMLAGLRDAPSDPDGTVWAGRWGMAHPKHTLFRSTSMRSVRRAMSKLIAVGLVKPLGNTRTKVGRGFAKTYEHAVLGVIVQPSPNALAGLEEDKPAGMYVPKETVRWMSQHVGRGGKRAGAGRPRKDVLRIQTGAGKRPEGVIQTGAPDRSVAPIGSGSPVGGANSLLLPSGEGSCPRRAGAVAACGTPVRGAETTSVDFFELAAQGGTVQLGNGDRNVPPPDASIIGPWCCLSGLPPHPGLDMIPPARMPAPRLLSEDATDQERVTALVVCFRAAFISRFGRTAPLCRNADSPNGRNFSRYARAAKMLLDHGMSPARWCLWSFDLWQDYVRQDATEKLRAPSLRWVLDPARALESVGRFKREDVAEVGDCAPLGKAHRRLLRLYREMRMAVVAERAFSEVARVVIAERFFPGKTYDRMVEDARHEVRMTQAALRAQVLAGR